MAISIFWKFNNILIVFFPFFDEILLFYEHFFFVEIELKYFN